jgi:septation ring formation regulator EzrA
MSRFYVSLPGCVCFDDDASVVWHAFGNGVGVTEQTFDQRVAFLEKSMEGKTLAEHFREHAELIDRRFTEVDLGFAAVHARLSAQDKRFEAIDAQFSAVHKRFDVMDERFNRIDVQFNRIDTQFSRIDAEFSRIGAEVSLLRDDVTGVHAKLDVILEKLNAT